MKNADFNEVDSWRRAGEEEFLAQADREPIVVRVHRLPIPI